MSIPMYLSINTNSKIGLEMVHIIVPIIIFSRLHFGFGFFSLGFHQRNYAFYEEINYLDPTDDGEAREEAHGATDGGDVVHHLHPAVYGDAVKGGRAHPDPHKLQLGAVLQI